MCAQIIEARVKQKKDTLANWNANPMILLDGEQAFVVGSTGQPINFKIGDGKKRFSELPWWISYDQGQFIQVVGNALPTPSVELGYTFVGPGEYTHANGNVTAPAGRFSQLVFQSGTWSLKDMGAFPDSSSKIAEFSAGTYTKDTVKTVGTTIYRAKVGTSQAPSATATDWEVLGSNLKLDVEGGALSFEKGSVFEKSLGSFVSNEKLVKEIKDADFVKGIINYNTLVNDVPNDGYFKMKLFDTNGAITMRYTVYQSKFGDIANNAKWKIIFGIKADDTKEVILENVTTGTGLVKKEATINISQYKQIGINTAYYGGAQSNVKLFEGVVHTEDEVKNYIDAKSGKYDDLLLSYQSGSIVPVRPTWVTGKYVTATGMPDSTQYMHFFYNVAGFEKLHFNFYQFSAGTTLFGVKGNIRTELIPRATIPGVVLDQIIDISEYDQIAVNAWVGDNTKEIDGKPVFNLRLESPEIQKTDFVKIGIDDIPESKTYVATPILMDTRFRKHFSIKALGDIIANPILYDDYTSIRISVSVEVASTVATSTGIVYWQNNQNTPLVAGKTYVVILTTYNRGQSWIGSIIGVWDTKAF